MVTLPVSGSTCRSTMCVANAPPRAGPLFFALQPPLSGGLPGEGAPPPADIRGALHKRHAAVSIDIDRDAGLQTDIEPISRGHATPDVWPLQRCTVVIAVERRLDGLKIANARVGRPIRASRAFPGGVTQTEL